MKAVVMAGGHGSRLVPLKRFLNKHTLPVYDKPMIEHVILSLARGGVDEVLVLLNLRYPETVMEILEDGNRFGCDIYYRYVCSVDGPGRQLWLAKKWVAGQDFVLMLGDALYLCDLDFRAARSPHMWTMPLQDLDDPSKYGQVKVSGDRVLELREKPKEFFSGLIQTAVWKLPPDAFDRAERLGKEHTGEVHVGMVTEQYVAEGLMTHTPIPPRSYIDLGTQEALFQGNLLLHERAQSAARRAAE